MHFQGSRLFIATNRGAFVYDKKELRKLDAAALRSTAVFAIESAEQGGLWLATDRGLYRLAFNGGYARLFITHFSIANTSRLSISKMVTVI